MTTFPKGTTVDTTNLQPVEVIHVDFSSYNMTFIRDFTSMITVVCENTIIILVFPTASKSSSVRIVCFILTTLSNEQYS